MTRRLYREDFEVEMFPCMVRGCGRHASGWADRVILELMGIELDVEAVDRIYLCVVHIAPVKTGRQQR